MSASTGIDTSSHTNYLVLIVKERAQALWPGQTDKYIRGPGAVNNLKQNLLLQVFPRIHAGLVGGARIIGHCETPSSPAANNTSKQRRSGL
jgi:hypothetical protein